MSDAKWQRAIDFKKREHATKYVKNAWGLIAPAVEEVTGRRPKVQIPEKIAMEIGGWADDGTMHKIYTHLAKKDIAKRAQDFSDFFDPEKRKPQT